MFKLAISSEAQFTPARTLLRLTSSKIGIHFSFSGQEVPVSLPVCTPEKRGEMSMAMKVRCVSHSRIAEQPSPAASNICTHFGLLYGQMFF